MARSTAGMMSDTVWSRIGGACGIAFVVLGFAGLFLLTAEHGGFTPPPGSSDQEITRYFANPLSVRGSVAVFIYLFAILLFIPFAARLWAALRRSDSNPDWLSAAALGAALVFVAVLVCGNASSDTIQLRAGHGLSAAEARTLLDLTNAFHVLSWATSGTFLILSAAAGFRARVLQTWLRWPAAAIGVIQLGAAAAPTASWAQTTELLFLLWVLAAAVTLTVTRAGA